MLGMSASLPDFFVQPRLDDLNSWLGCIGATEEHSPNTTASTGTSTQPMLYSTASFAPCLGVLLSSMSYTPKSDPENCHSGTGRKGDKQKSAPGMLSDCMVLLV